MVDVDTRRSSDEAIAVLVGRLTPLSTRARFEFVTDRTFTGIVDRHRVLVWPIGPSSGDVGMWHQWRPVFSGQWIDRRGTTHLIGEISLNAGVFVVMGIVSVIVAAWLFAGVRAVVLGLGRQTPLDPMLLLGGVAMPLLFGVVAVAIFWSSYRLYVSDRVELQSFLQTAFEPGDDLMQRSIGQES
jgi:hypothetical protein